MVIGLLQLELHLNNTHSLKNKRSVISRLRSQVQKKYNVSFSEVGMHDLWGRAEIALTTASTDSRVIDRMFTALEDQIERYPAVRIIKRHMELL
ncbi:MAG TPA: DUF503 domain-containing protein [bacterium]|nr:DUF503 domain-containing protein [bacterium]